MWFMCDVETNGPCPGLYSMLECGLIAIDGKENSNRFHGKYTELDGSKIDPEAVAFMEKEARPLASGKGPGYHEAWGLCKDVTESLFNWIIETNKKASSKHPMFISDNNGFDWQFINYYLWKYCGSNPFGHSSTNMGSLYKGAVGDAFLSFKHLRKTSHTHHPVDDCLGNVEALTTFCQWKNIKGYLP